MGARGDRASKVEAVQPQHERRALPGLRSCPNLASMRLHYLVNNREAKPGTALEVRLKGLKDFFDLLRAHARPSVRKPDLPVLSDQLHRDGECASTFHRADRILAEIPKDLLDFISIGGRPGLTGREPALNRDAGFLRRHAVIHQRQSIFDELDQVHFVKMILLGTRIGQKVGDDAVEPLRLTSHNVEQAAMIVIHLWDTGKHADRPCNGSKRISNFVRDGSSQSADRSQPVLGSHFALQAPNLGEIVKNVDVSQFPALRHGQGCHPHPNRLAELRGSIKTYLAVSLLRFHGGQRVEKQRVHRGSQQFRRGTLKQPLGSSVHESDTAIETGSDQPAADGVNNVLVQRLQTFERAARCLQFYTHLPQFGSEQSRKVRHGQESKQVDKDNCLQDLQTGMRGAVRRNQAIVVQFQDGPVKNESQGSHQVRPDARQQHAGDDDDERIEEVEGTIPASGFMDDKAGQDQIRNHLQRGLQPMLLPQGEQKHIEQRKAVPEKDGADEEPDGQWRRSELSHGQFNPKQEGQDENADPHQPD